MNPARPVVGGRGLAEPPPQPVPKRKLQDLVDKINPNEKLDPDVEEMLLEIADDFLSSVTAMACSLAKHRKSEILDVKDLKLHLEKNYNISVPGFTSSLDDIRPTKKAAMTDLHKQRLQAAKKAMSSSSK
eukprot:tig00020538_g10377.t1